MAISLGILFGIIAMLGWGIADFFIAKAVRKTSVIKTFLWSQIIGLLFYLPFIYFFLNFPIFSLNTIIIILISGLIGIISLLAFYKGLQVGYVSVISPISSSAAVVTVILSLIFLNEALTGLQALGVSLAILGTILTSFKIQNLLKLKLKNMAKGVQYALIAMVGWGILFVFIDVLVSRLDWFLPILIIKALGVPFILAYSNVLKKNISFPKNVGLFIVLGGILEAIAFLAFGFSITSENTSIVAPIVFAFPAVTIILARIFFKEILELNQKIGVVTVLSGLVLLSL